MTLAVVLSVKPVSCREKFHGRAMFMRRNAFIISAVTLLPGTSVVNCPTKRCFTVPLCKRKVYQRQHAVCCTLNMKQE